jgi:acyl-CoA dehydrogenase family protein 9
MRDFRVTTIFEGTTEIHSIYPPLFVLRHLDKQMRKGNSSTFSKLMLLLKGMFGRAQWKLRFNNKIMNRAARLVKANARTIRWLLHAGLLVYGKRIHNNQFFLRRLTTVSLYLFGLISVLAKIDAAQKVGADVSEDLKVLDYLVGEAREARRGNKSLFRSRREALHQEIFRGIVSRLSEGTKA